MTALVVGKGRWETKRYPLGPLEALIRVHLGERLACVSDGDVARVLGTSRRYLFRWRELGLVRDTAERIAEAAGFLPYEVWPELLQDTIADVERVCAADDCDNRFIPSYPRGMKKRYCCRNCNLRVSTRERYRANPEPKRAYQREYDRMVREAKRRRQERAA